MIEFPVPDAKTPADALKRAEAFAQEFAHDELITPSIAPHAVYTLDAATLTAASNLAKKYNIPLQIHLAETQAEIGLSQERHKMRPVALLDSLKFWAPVTIGAHGVWITPEEIAVLKQRNVGISNNPESNMKLASGTAPVVGYRAAGVNVGLGTDGAASNNDLDMFEAMRQAAFQQKLVNMDPRVISAPEALELATIGGARVLGQQARIGSIEAGKRADIIVVNMDRARQTPMFDPVSQIVYVTRGDDVETTIVHGKVLMRGRKVLTLDESRGAGRRAEGGRPGAKGGRTVALLLEDADVRQVAVLLGVVEAVADDELVFDGEADVVDLDVDLAARRLAQAGKPSGASAGRGPGGSPAGSAASGRCRRCLRR